jgi:CTP synthase (UTP-ammonia lyase)
MMRGCESPDGMPTKRLAIIELSDHPFYMGTLFVPQSTSSEASPHPAILVFIDAAM